MKPGVYDLPADVYHADPADTPSLSASVAQVLLTKSPLHAMWAHPKLSPAYQREEREDFDLGTAAHAYLLEDAPMQRFEVIEAPDWRTKVAKDARDIARADGRIPILAHRWADVVAMATAARQQLAAHAARPFPFFDGRAEETLIWEDEGVLCRARLDWLHADHRTIDDYKSTSASAHPEAWTRGPLFAHGCDLQAAWYARGVHVLFGTAPTVRFVVQETTPPYALSVIDLGPDVLALAEQKRLAALRIWRECLRTGLWPSYPSEVCSATLPPWIEAAWAARGEPLRAARAAEDGDIDDLFFGEPS